MAKQAPSLGRIVHYKLESGRSRGEYRPAIITHVNEPDDKHPEVTVDVTVFFDGFRDQFNQPMPARAVTEGDGEGQYTWPPKV